MARHTRASFHPLFSLGIWFWHFFGGRLSYWNCRNRCLDVHGWGSKLTFLPQWKNPLFPLGFPNNSLPRKPNSFDAIICENPKHSLKLLSKLGIKKKLFSLHDYNEKIIINKIEKYAPNSSFALISDAGSPLISDPGYKLLQYFSPHIRVGSIGGRVGSFDV